MCKIVTSKDNPNIKRLRKLISSKKERLNQGLFVIEGIRSLKEAIKEHIVLSEVFFSESAYEKYQSIADEAAAADSIFVISNELADKITDSVSTQGVFALAPVVHKDISLLDSGAKRILILDNLQDPGNLGTILRTADAVGIDAVILCENCCELYNPKVIRSTAGSVFRLNIIVCGGFEEVCKAIKNTGAEVFAAVVDRDAEHITKLDFPKRCAVVIGNEGNGIPTDHANLCDRRITVDMRGNTESLNASVAAAIILWEMTK